MQGDRVPSPFDGRKVAYHLQYWGQMLRQQIPPPVLVTLDPINLCNLKCKWCNGDGQMKRSQSAYSSQVIHQMGPFLKDWGVKAVCIAGGGEPLLHQHASLLIDNIVTSGVEVGVVTNGTLVNGHFDALGRCRWVSVSVDAGCAETYQALKGRDTFSQTINNIVELRNRWPSLEITYKFLLHPDNIGDIRSAALLAKSIGCTYFHCRPAGRTWEDVQRGDRSRPFGAAQICDAVGLLKECEDLNGDGFSVQVITDKFSKAWGIEHNFPRCWALGMTCVIQPDGTVSLCCDRRGDKKVQLCEWQQLRDIKRKWNTGAHWDKIVECDLRDCPRCTYAPHNELFDSFVVHDHACKNFI